jgi:Transposase DDE domain group 1
VGDDPGDGPGPWPVAGRWTGGAPRVHDPGKIVADLAAALALGGDCLPTSRCCGTSRTWPDLELRHRRARCEDRIRNAEDTGLRNLPLKGYAQNQVWCEIVALACELLAWMRLLALTGKARRWEPKRLRLRIFAVAGRLASSGRRLRRPLEAGPGPCRSPPRPADCGPFHPADQLEPPPRHGRRNHQGPGTPPTRRDSRAARHGQPLKISQQPPPQATTSRTRKIEVRR